MHRNPLQCVSRFCRDGFTPSPLVWLRRFPHRRGYGIHSPWAYAFVRGVLLERGHYYAYAELEHTYPWLTRRLRHHTIQCQRLMLRLANYAQAQNCLIYGSGAKDESSESQHPEWPWLHAGAPQMRLTTISANGQTDVDDATDALTIVRADALANYLLQPCQMLVVEGIHQDKAHLKIWHQIQADERTGCTFDLYSYGIVFFDRKRHKQHYIISFP